MPEQRYSIESRPDGLVIDITPWFKCSVHRKTVHSYVASNNVLLGNKGITSNKYDKDRFKPIPQVVTYLTSALEAAKTRKTHCLMQAARSMKDIEFSFEKQMNNCAAKFEAAFNKIRSTIDQLETKIFNDLNKIKEAQLERIQGLFDKMNKVNEIIKCDIEDIDQLLALNPREKVEKGDAIRQIKRSKDNYYKDFEFSDLESVSFKFSAKGLPKIKRILNDSFKTSLKTQEKMFKEISKTTMNIK